MTSVAYTLSLIHRGATDYIRSRFVTDLAHLDQGKTCHISVLRRVAGCQVTSIQG
jgi:hypothetical protein